MGVLFAYSVMVAYALLCNAKNLEQFGLTSFPKPYVFRASRIKDATRCRLGQGFVDNADNKFSFNGQFVLYDRLMRTNSLVYPPSK